MSKEVILEYISLGNAVKVTAMDTLTKTEASIVGSTGATQQELARLAIKKLEYVLSKNKSRR